MSIERQRSLLIGLALMALLALTRGQHAITLYQLPEASWAVFFLAGFYIRQTGFLGLLLAEAALLDFAAITFGGVGDFCITPAYGFLLPAYGSLWMAGRWYQSRHQYQWSSVPLLAASLMLGAVAAEVFSSGSFYLLSGSFAAPTLAEYATRALTYFPGYLSSLMLYVGIAAMLDFAWHKRHKPQTIV